MERKENNQMQDKGSVRGNNQTQRQDYNQSRRGEEKRNGNKEEYIKGFDTCLKKCSSDIDILKSKKSSNSEIDELDEKRRNLSRKFEELKKADQGHFEEMKNDFETESEELLKCCEEAIGSC